MDARVVLSVLAVACALLATTASGHNVARSSEKYNVIMEATSSSYVTLGLGENFTFSCSVMAPNGTTVEHPSFKLVMSGDADHKKSAKVTNKTSRLKENFTYSTINYTDDQTTFSCQYNHGNQTYSSHHNLTLTVFYGPQLTLVNKTKIHGDNDTNASVVIEIVSNPPVENYTWTMNGVNLSNSSNVMVMPCGLYFTPLLADFMGNYSVQECNNISCSDLTFPLYVYYAPLFVGNVRNASLLTEIATGRNRTLTCTVAEYSGPDPLNITLTNRNIPPSKYNHTNTSSMTLTITNASQSDAVNYTFLACCGKQPQYCSYLNFSTFVGGPPNASLISISCRQKINGTQFNISCNVTDKNLAPVTMLKFSMPGLGLTETLYFNTTDQVPINNQLPPLFSGSLESIFAYNYSLQVVAGNQLNSSVPVYSTNLYLAGLNNVTIQAENSPYQTLGKGNEFNFTCAVHMDNGTVEHPNISLAIHGSGNSTKKLAKVTNETGKHGVKFTYSITDYIDDQTIFVCQYSQNSHLWPSPNLTLTVFYGPQLTLVNKTVHGDNDTNASVVIEMVANPPIKNYTWTMNGNNLSNSSNVTVMPCGLYFTPLLADFMGNYSVQECNNISCSNLTFPLYVYYAPLFVGNLRNASLLTEIATGRNRSLTCTVADYSGPDPLHLTLTNHNIPPSKYNHTNTSSMTLTITNASESDTANYTFLACCGKQPQYCSYLSFPTFVGGRPENASLVIESVHVSTSTSGKYNLTIAGNLTDHSDVPVTQIKFAIKQTGTSRNVSVKAPLNGETQEIQSSEVINANQLGGKPLINVDVYAVNDLGSSPVAMVTASLPLEPSPEPTATPTPSPKPKSKVGVIVVAVLVPLAFIAFLIVAAVGGYIYYKRQKGPKGFTRLVPSNDDANDVTDGVYDAT